MKNMISSKSETTLKLSWTLLLVYSVSMVLAFEHRSVKEGDDVLLECNKKKPLTWLNKDGEIIGRQKGRIQQNVHGNLGIRPVQLSDRGIYTCAGLNSNIVHKQIELEVLAAPTLVNITHTVEVEKNKDAVINCLAEGHPDPKITWFMYKAGQKHKIAEGTTLHARMPCSYCQEQFFCRAENEFGADSVNITVNVVGKPEVKAIENSIATAIGQNVTLQCTIRSNPIINYVQWLKHGKLVQNSNRRKINFKMQNTYEFVFILSIEKLKEKDLGDYQCLASNKHGNETQNIQITLNSRKSDRIPKKNPRVSPLSASTELVISSEEIQKETTKSKNQDSKASNEEEATQSSESVSSNIGSVCKNSWKQFTAMILLPFFMYTSLFLS